MGRIAPRRRKSPGVYQKLLHVCLNLSQRLKSGPATPEEPKATEEVDLQLPQQNSKGSAFKTFLLQLWHLPDSFHWMEPLPYFHRRWVLVSGAVLLLSLLWPYSGDNVPHSLPASNQGIDIPLQAHLQDNSPPSAQQPDSGNWLRYQIQAGQTLAQLFRDNNLPVNDVFAMAQVEGNEKPLSNLQAGQEVRIERSPDGLITALSVTTSDGREALFRRQNDGSYLRIR